MEISGSFKVVLRAGNKEEARIESRGIPLEDIKIYVKGNRLYIKRKTTKQHYPTSSHASITVTFTKLNTLVNTGSSDVLVESKLEGESCFIENTGSGDIETAVSCQNLEVQNTGSGSVSLKSISKGESYSIENTGSGEIVASVSCQNLEAQNSGSGELSITSISKGESYSIANRGSGEIVVSVSCQNLEAQNTGTGEITLRGNTGNLEIDLQGPGDIHAYRLKANSADISILGSGDAYVTVIENIDAQITGSGNIHYKGSPKQVEVQAVGSGKARAVKE